MSRPDTVLVLALLILFWLAAILGVPEQLGAHPWWAVRAGFFGSLIGAAAAIGLRIAGLDGPRLLWLTATGFVIALAAATVGKHFFVASMAENALAGMFWFYGWFAVVAMLFLFGFTLLRRRKQR